MSAYLADYALWTNQGGIVGKVYCDTAADLPATTAFSDFGTLTVSTKAYVISTGQVYMLNGSGSWVLQPSENNIQLDLTGYYTSAQTDSAISAGVTAAINNLDAGLYDIDPDETIQYIYETNGVIGVQKQDIQIATSQVTDLDTTLAGLYPLDTYTTIPDNTNILTLGPGKYVKITGLSTLTNRPSGYTGGILLIVEKLSTSGRRRMTLYPISESFNTVNKYVILENTTTLGTWGNWVRFDGGTVLS